MQRKRGSFFLAGVAAAVAALSSGGALLLLAAGGCSGGNEGGTTTGLRGVATLSTTFEPVAGATIRAHRIVCDPEATGAAPCTTETDPAARTTTDAQGNYVLGLAPGTYRVFGSGTAASGATATAYRSEVTVAESGLVTLDLTFFPPRVIQP